MITHSLGTEVAAGSVIKAFFLKESQTQPWKLPHLLSLRLLAAL